MNQKEARGLGYASWMDESSGLLPDSLSSYAIHEFVTMSKCSNRIPEAIVPTDTETILDHYNLLCFDGTVSNAGALLFSDHPNRINRGASLRIDEFDADSVLTREDIIDAPLILVPDRAVDLLFKNCFQFVAAYDGSRCRYPKEAIMELIVNAVVHMDYGMEEPVTVSVHPDRLEITNSGCLPDGLNERTLHCRHRSVPRNRTLANAFHDAGRMDCWGQRILRAMDQFRANGNSEPQFVTVGERHTVSVASGSDSEERSGQTKNREGGYPTVSDCRQCTCGGPLDEHAMTEPLRELTSERQDLSFESLILSLGRGNIFPEVDRPFLSELGLLDGEGRYNLNAYLLSDRNAVPARTFYRFRDPSAPEVHEVAGVSLLFQFVETRHWTSCLRETRVDLSKGAREELDLFDLRAFDAALAEAFVSNDWRGLEAPYVTVYADRIEVAHHVAEDLYPSAETNPCLREIFKRMGYLGDMESVPKVSRRREGGISVATIPFRFVPSYVPLRRS